MKIKGIGIVLCALLGTVSLQGQAAPRKPAFAKDATDTRAGSLTLKQAGNVPAGETYVVIVSKTEISGPGSKVSATAVVSGLGVGQVSERMFSGDPRIAVFTSLDGGLNYYVYVISVKGTHKVVQAFRAAISGDPPSAPDYVISTIAAGLRFTQSGNVPDD
ncbi:MAG: hypothetical protein OXB93_05115, partial [Cytophagales bacterium]|nr:hypothetical protein [Cytophagales bacterium]